MTRFLDDDLWHLIRAVLMAVAFAAGAALLIPGAQADAGTAGSGGQIVVGG